MSEFHVKVIRVGPITKHPNADNLSITDVTGYPVILRTGEFVEGDKAVYVPIDALVPLTDPRWVFLKGHSQIRAARLRGIFSMGLLTRADPSWELGQDVREALGIKKFEPTEPAEGNLRDPGYMPVYTDIVGLRPNPDILVEGEEVVMTEKIHGESARYVLAVEVPPSGVLVDCLMNVLWAGSRTSPWSHDLRKLAEGNSQLAEHVREGFVVRPVKERWDPRIGRVILKLHGEGFLLRKG